MTKSREYPVPQITARPWASLIAGGAGGMTAAVLTSPLDVLRTRLQSNHQRVQVSGLSISLFRLSSLHLQQTFSTISSIRRYEGWRGLFSGLGPNLIGIIPASAIKFYSYGTSKKFFSDLLDEHQGHMLVHTLSATTAGISTSTITNPIWVIKTRLQLDNAKMQTQIGSSNRRYKNSIDCILKILRLEGPRGLYRGMTASYIGVIESTAHWVLYEQAKGHLRRRKDLLRAQGAMTDSESIVVGLLQAGAAGGTKLIAAIIAYPHEVLRTRLRQAPTETGNLKYSGLLQCFRLVWKEEGLGALYGGLTPHLLRVVPSTAIMFGVYELTMVLLQR